MGRERLRRGYSLEVIFEEDSDIHSHSSDSSELNAFKERQLEILPILQEYSQSNQNQQSLSNFQLKKEEKEILASSQLDHQISSEKQHLKKIGSHLQEEIFLDVMDMESCYVEWGDSNYPNESLSLENKAKFFSGTRKILEYPPTQLSPSSDSQIPSGRQSRVSRRQIVEAVWLTDFDEIEENQEDHVIEDELKRQDELDKLAQEQDHSVLIIHTNENFKNKELRQNTTLFVKDIERFSENSFKSSDEDSTAYSNSPSPRNDELCIMSSSDLLSSSNELGESSRSISVASSSSLTRNEIYTGSCDVKKVRAIFEQNGKLGIRNGCSTSASSSSEDEASTTSGTASTSSTNSKYIKRTNQINSSKSKLEKKISSGSNCSSISVNSAKSSVTNPTIKSNQCSAFSNINLKNIESNDLIDLLSNDNIIIEEQPDLFQIHRNQRMRVESQQYDSFSVGNCSSSSASQKSTLRRSKSVGTGIQNLQDELLLLGDSSLTINCSNPTLAEHSKSKPCILAEELPPRNTVSKVRSVFEEILQRNRKTTTSSSSERVDNFHSIVPRCYTNTFSAGNGHSLTSTGLLHDKSSLSSIKSFPTSKIFRSESAFNLNSPSPTSGNTPGINKCMNDSSLISFPSGSKESSYGTTIQLKCNLSSCKDEQKSVMKENGAKIVKEFEQVAVEKGKANDTTDFNMKHDVRELVEGSCLLMNGKHRKNNANGNKHQNWNKNMNNGAGENITGSWINMNFPSKVPNTIIEDKPKYISPDVLNRIRSLGTTITFYGGEIISQTIGKSKGLKFPIKNSLQSIKSKKTNDIVSTQNEDVLDGPSFRKTESSISSKQTSQVDSQDFLLKPKSNQQCPSTIPAFHQFNILDSMCRRENRLGDTTPRIISVLPKSPSNSPPKINSPVHTPSLLHFNRKDRCSMNDEHSTSTSGTDSDEDGQGAKNLLQDEAWIHHVPILCSQDKNNESKREEDAIARILDSSSSTEIDPNIISPKSLRSSSKPKYFNAESITGKISKVGTWF